MNSNRQHVVLYINGQRHEIKGDHALRPITDYLRYTRRLTGTKVVCAEGDCGACTLLVARPSGDRPWRFEPVNACIIATAQLDGAHILTIEAVRDGDEPHEVQRAMTACHGSQCGFCTPGFVMAMMGHFEHHTDKPATERDIKNALTGNLCRCTGYLPIVEAGVSVRPGVSRSLTERYHSKAIEIDLEGSTATSLEIATEHGELHAPRSLDELLALRAKHPSARLIAGNTDLGVLFNKGAIGTPGVQYTMISLSLVKGLDQVTITDQHLTVGALTTLGELERLCVGRVDELSRLLRVFASPQIKSMATLVGNVANGSPIGDTIPALFALNAEVELCAVGTQRWVALKDFYLGYKQFALRKDEVITRLRMDVLSASTGTSAEVFRAYKVCQRKDLDISFVSSAYRLRVENSRILSAKILYGGVGPTVVSLPNVEQMLQGGILQDKALIERSAKAIERDVSPRTDVRGSEVARRLLAANMFRRFALEYALTQDATAVAGDPS